MLLSDICSFKNGKGIKITNSGNYPIVGSTGIIGYSNEYMIDKPIVAIARVGAQCGFVQYINFKSWITDNTIICIPNNDYDAKYIYYLLSTININSLHIGAAQPLMTSSILKSIEIINHSKLERQHIVDTRPLFHLFF